MRDGWRGAMLSSWKNHRVCFFGRADGTELTSAVKYNTARGSNKVKEYGVACPDIIDRDVSGLRNLWR
jgi:hypothetical protein